MTKQEIATKCEADNRVESTVSGSYHRVDHIVLPEITGKMNGTAPI